MDNGECVEWCKGVLGIPGTGIIGTAMGMASPKRDARAYKVTVVKADPNIPGACLPGEPRPTCLSPHKHAHTRRPSIHLSPALSPSAPYFNDVIYIDADDTDLQEI